jgi:hypothetical protein
MPVFSRRRPQAAAKRRAADPVIGGLSLVIAGWRDVSGYERHRVAVTAPAFGIS